MSTVHLQRRCEALQAKYSRRGGRMYASDIAIEEDCSTQTALRMMRAGEFGELHARNKRVLWVLVDGYLDYLASKTVVIRASA